MLHSIKQWFFGLSTSFRMIVIVIVIAIITGGVAVPAIILNMGLQKQVSTSDQDYTTSNDASHFNENTKDLADDKDEAGSANIGQQNEQNYNLSNDNPDSQAQNNQQNSNTNAPMPSSTPQKQPTTNNTSPNTTNQPSTPPIATTPVTPTPPPQQTTPTKTNEELDNERRWSVRSVRQGIGIYQKYNRGRTPTMINVVDSNGYASWEAITGHGKFLLQPSSSRALPSYSDGNIAAKFVNEYVNHSSVAWREENILLDPDGLAYGVMMTEYDYFLQQPERSGRIIYIVHKALCGTPEVKKVDLGYDSIRNFAILIKLSDNSMYCLDNG